MYHKLVFLIVILGVLCVDIDARRCGRRKLRNCRNKLEELNQQVASLDDDEDFPCDQASDVKECFVNYAEECYRASDEVQEFLGENIDELRGQLSSKCGISDQETELMQCIEPVEEDAGKCAETVVAQLMNYYEKHTSEASSLNQSQVQCMVFGMVMECVIDKVNERCGSEIAEVFRQGVREESKEIVEACENGQPIDIDLVESLKKKK